jgi:prepilin-type N-terminal cleavage/methylation domain-containing protein
LVIGHSPRRGLTLLEVLLVLCMLAALAALAAPALDRPFANQRLAKTADVVRALWARARVDAVEAGCIRAFRCLPGTGQYRVESLNIDGSDPSVDPVGFASLPGTVERILPDGLSFAGLSVNAMPADAGENGWLGPVLFYPDGTSSDALLTLNNRVGRTIDVSLRGLTGVATVGVIQTGAEP